MTESSPWFEASIVSVPPASQMVWKKRAYFQETAGDETAFVLQRDGGVLGVGRHGGGRNAQLLRSKPPYPDWERKDLGRSIGGPLLAKWGDRITFWGCLGSQSTIPLGTPAEIRANPAVIEAYLGEGYTELET